MRPIRSLFGPSYLPEVSMTDGSNGTWLTTRRVTRYLQLNISLFELSVDVPAGS